MSHRCHAQGCDKEIPPRKLFCLKHWRMTPRRLQARVWAEYREGQEIRKDPSGAYLQAMLDAIAAVAVAEGRE